MEYDVLDLYLPIAVRLKAFFIFLLTWLPDAPNTVNIKEISMTLGTLCLILIF
jgi:hypothetical protein